MGEAQGMNRGGHGHLSWKRADGGRAGASQIYVQSRHSGCSVEKSLEETQMGGRKTHLGPNCHAPDKSGGGFGFIAMT